MGLCICFYDFVEIGDGYIYPSEGAAHRKGTLNNQAVSAGDACNRTRKQHPHVIFSGICLGNANVLSLAVVFRLVVFHPFVGEVLVGKVVGSNKDGLKGTARRGNRCSCVSLID